MKKHSIIATAILTALSTGNAYAAQITGKVIDSNKQPISGAKVHLHGKKQSVITDRFGKFSINTDSDSQLHITKNNFIDQRVDIKADQGNVLVSLEPSSVESIVVYASALHKNNLEMASPVSVLSGDELKKQAKPTLGETLKGQPGINASYFGPVSSSPIIRGLDGPRVKITQNGLDSSDASRIGPDHATTNESLAAEQIEVLRGPATLLYGSGAIGGVVNVVDNRIPTDIIDTTTGAVGYSFDTVSNTNTYAALLETGKDGFNFHFDGVVRNGKDYDTPDYPSQEEHGDHDEHETHEEHSEHEDHEEHEENETLLTTVPNTFIDSQQVNFGTSYVTDHLTVGFSFGRIDTDYGIPAHNHAHHDHDHDHDHDHSQHADDEHVDNDHENEEHSEENVFARVKQDRWQALFNYALHNDYIENINVKAGFTDYQHSEIEGGTVGTTFKNKTSELRTSVEHKLAGWHGIIGYHFSDSDYEAQGAEAFTPATETMSHAIYVLEEKQFGDFTLEVGARVEEYQLSSVITESSHEEHEDHDHDHDHDHDEHDENRLFAYELNQTNMSYSIGGVYNYTNGQNIAINISHSERSPLTAELLSNGTHIATSTYELGLGYHLEDGEAHFEPEDIQQEVSTNFDISFRKFTGDFGYTLNFFYNDVENYYYQENTGLIYSAEHGIEEADHEHEGALPVYQFKSQDAELYGFELDTHYKLNEENTVKLFADSITAKLKDSSYLPRIPSNKIGVKYEYALDNLVADLTVTRYASQNNIASYESKTAGYTLVDFSMQYDFELAGNDVMAYFNIDNLTDELGFVHTSVIKEQAPLPGRNFKVGVRAFF